MKFKAADVALVVSGFAAVVAIACLNTVRKQNVAMHDRLLALEAKQASLEAKQQQAENAVMLAMVERLHQFCLDVTHGDEKACAEPDGARSASFDESVVMKVGMPVRDGAKIRVKVPPEVVRAVIDHSDAIPSDVALVPAVKAGKNDGFTVSDLRSGGLAAALGFHKGDVVHAIALDGKPFDPSANEAYDSLGKARAVRFDLDRDGSPMSLEIEVGK